MKSRSNALLRRSGDELVWLEDLVSSPTRRPYRLVITYPGDFPYRPPSAFIALHQVS